MSQSLEELLQLPQRKLVVSQAEITLDSKLDNTVFVLLVEESRGSAGGRAAGSGSRKIVKICGFSCKTGTCEKIFETEEEARIEQFDIPYSAVAMDIRLADGRPYVVQGVIDPGMISSYLSASGNLK
ncbi:MAG TPA: hypothetical protein VJL54_09320 [Nitrososphaera sp.]|nr:hypothetical protein [Nitrososphaera sp.]